MKRRLSNFTILVDLFAGLGTVRSLHRIKPSTDTRIEIQARRSERAGWLKIMEAAL